MQVSYVHGVNLISQNRDGNSSLYLFDGHSGVRLLSDESGVVTDSYNYDAYGSLLASTGNTENSYLYRGEQFDANVDLQYLRARYYDLSLGRFASVDPFEGMPSQPLSRHRYLYGYDNPMSYFDPSGESSIAEKLGGIQLLDILAVALVVSSAAGLLINATTAYRGRRDRNGWPWHWEGVLGSAGLATFAWTSAHLVSECYKEVGGQWQTRGRWQIPGFGFSILSVPVSMTLTSVIVRAKSDRYPRITDVAFAVASRRQARQTICHNTNWIN